MPLTRGQWDVREQLTGRTNREIEHVVELVFPVPRRGEMVGKAEQDAAKTGTQHQLKTQASPRADREVPDRTCRPARVRFSESQDVGPPLARVWDYFDAFTTKNRPVLQAVGKIALLPRL